MTLRCADCGSTHIIVGDVAPTGGTDWFGWGCRNSTVYTGAMPLGATGVLEAIDSLFSIDFKIDGPQWGWWAAYYPPHPIARPRLNMRPHRPIRAQARACRIDRKRWKRKRFVQRLRSRL